MLKTALKLLKKIENSGYEAYIVGGYVRDYILGLDSIDVDITTNATPMDIKRIFKDICLPNEEYGSVKIIIKNIHFEITTYRKEYTYLNNRKPIEIEYISDLVEDLKRRDFTINTLCMDSNGEIIDLLGAKEDLDNKVVRMVGNPKKRLKEDALRILRAIRFATILNFELDNNLKRYLKKYGYLLNKLSYFRKQSELERIFTSSNVEYGIRLLKELDLVKYLELSNIDNLVITPSLIGIWSQLGVKDIYNFSNQDKKIIDDLNELKNKDLYDKKVLYKYGLYTCSIAAEVSGIPKKIITKKYNDLVIHSIKDLDIGGNDINNILNKKGGKIIKQILNDLENKVLDGELENNFNELKKYIVDNYLEK